MMRKFIEYDAKNSSSLWRTYKRIRVCVDVRKPLKSGNKIRRNGGEMKMVKFKYERMGVFCFFYGMLGHVDTSYEKLFQKDDEDGLRGWGPVLKVERRRNGGILRCRWLGEEGGGR